MKAARHKQRTAPPSLRASELGNARPQARSRFPCRNSRRRNRTTRTGCGNTSHASGWAGRRWRRLECARMGARPYGGHRPAELFKNYGRLRQVGESLVEAISQTDSLTRQTERFNKASPQQAMGYSLGADRRIDPRRRQIAASDGECDPKRFSRWGARSRHFGRVPSPIRTNLLVRSRKVI